MEGRDAVDHASDGNNQATDLAQQSPTSEIPGDGKSVASNPPFNQHDVLQAIHKIDSSHPLSTEAHQQPDDGAGPANPANLPIPQRRQPFGSGRNVTFPSVEEEPTETRAAKSMEIRREDLPDALFSGELATPAGAKKKKGSSRTSVRRCSLQHIPISQELLDQRFFGHFSEDGPRLDRSLSPPRALRSASSKYNGRAAGERVDKIDESAEVPDRVEAITWNIAAINNNPFEFWVSHHAPEYLTLMEKARNYIQDEDEQHDVEVFHIFTDDMFDTLKQDLVEIGMGEGLDELDAMWRNHYRGLRVLTQFLKDKSIGSKRLISMPDRIANTVTTADGAVVMRPSVVSSFEGDMSSTEVWWLKWRQFMFKTKVQLLGAEQSQPLATLLKKIPKAKYPAITEKEEAVSIPLQILALGIFDASLVNMLNCIAPQTWMELKRSLSDSLVKNKSRRLVDILTETHADADVIFIQEASVAFVELVKERMAGTHFVISPSAIDFSRNQNSIILAHSARFAKASVTEVTGNVLSRLDSTCVAAGDLCVATIHGIFGRRYVLASFHGDSNGFSTMPVMKALHRLMNEDLPDHYLVAGLDANTASTSTVAAFQASLESLGITSCWTALTSVGAWTSCAARTFLQPQLQKAQPFDRILQTENTKLKDWVVFYSSQLTLISLARDNTGQGRFEQKVVPTMTFPSDHVLVKAVLSFEQDTPPDRFDDDIQSSVFAPTSDKLGPGPVDLSMSSVASTPPFTHPPPSPASPYVHLAHLGYLHSATTSGAVTPYSTPGECTPVPSAPRTPSSARHATDGDNLVLHHGLSRSSDSPEPWGEEAGGTVISPGPQVEAST